MSKTLGQLLDEYIATELTPGQEISSLYLYMEDYQTPKAIVNTEEASYDYTDVLYKVVDFRVQATEAEAKVKSLQAKIRQLEHSKKEVEKAIKLLKGEL